MKKLILAFIALLSLSCTFAQKNSILVFGYVSGSTNSQSDTIGRSSSSTSINFNPGVGYQFSDHWTVGINLSYILSYIKYSNSNGNPSNNDKNQTYGGGLFMRYTQPISNVFFIYAHFNANYTTGSNTFTDGGVTTTGGKTYLFSTAITPALGINIKNGYAVSLSCGNVGYSYLTNSAKSTNSGLTFNLGGTLGITFSKNIMMHSTKSVNKG